MAETGNKRSSMGGRAPVPTPRVQQNQSQNSQLAPLDVTLNRLIGARVRVKVSNVSHEFTGFVVNVSTAQQVLSISPNRLGSAVVHNANANANASNMNGGGGSSSNGSGITMINVTSIENFQVLELAPAMTPSPRTVLPTLTNIEVERNVRAGTERALEEAANQGKDVTAEAQELYNALRRMLPMRWAERGGAFIVNENTLVEPPYGPDNCRLADGVAAGPTAEKAIAYVRKLLESERKKLSDKKTPNISHESPKKGG